LPAQASKGNNAQLKGLQLGVGSTLHFYS